MTNLDKLLETLKDIPETEEISEDFKYKVGDYVITHRFYSENHLDYSADHMDQYINVRGKITTAQHDREFYQVHGWWWTKDSLILSKNQND